MKLMMIKATGGHKNVPFPTCNSTIVALCYRVL